MTWARFDDAFWSHPKTLRAGNEAVGAFVRIVCYCSQHLTDGVVDEGVAKSIAGRRAVLSHLVEVGLLSKESGSFRVHDYLVFQSSRAQILAARASKTERQSRWRSGLVSDAKDASISGNPEIVDASTQASQDASTAPSRDATVEPAPSHPIPSHPSKKKNNTSESTGADAPASASAGGVVLDLFKHWQRVHEHPTAKLDPKRRRAIERAIESHGADVVRAAIDGCARSEWHQGKNDRGQVYDDLTLILRDASKIEGFAALATPATKQPQVHPAKITAEYVAANNPFKRRAGGDR